MRRLVGLVAAVPAFFVVGAILPNGLPLGVVVLGVVLGSLQALTALGLVLLYRSSRIINLAQAEIGGLAAAAAVVLVAGKGVPYLVAVPVGLAVAAITGALIDATVVRRLFTAPRLIVMVATIGLAQIVGAAEIAMPHLFGKLKPFTTFHAPFSFTFRVGPLVFGADHVTAVAVAVVALGGLWWFLVRSDSGIAVRATADSQERAALLGIPVRRLSRLTWIIAAVLSGAGAMFSAPILGANLGVAAGPVALLVPLAAAVIGRMDNLVRTALAAVALSVFQQGVFWSYPRSSVVDVGLFLFVLVALIGQQRQATREEDTELGSYVAARQPRPVPRSVALLPEVRWAKAVSIALVALAGVVLLLTLSQSRLLLVSYIAIYGIVAISLVVLTGWSGQISLGQFAFVAVGAGVAGGLYVNAGVDLAVALLAAVVIGALAAIVVGAPALRLPGHLLAVATLAFAVPVSTWLLNRANFPALTPLSIPRPKLFGWIALSSPRSFAATCFAALAVAWLLMANLRRTRAGRAILGVRDNERAAAAYGIDPTRTRLVAFGAAGALCGLAGALYALALRGIGFAGFDPGESIQAFTMVVVGGLGSLGTAVLGATYVRGAQDFTHGAAQLLATGAGLLFLLLLVPGGLGSIVTAGRDRYLRWVAARHRIDPEQGIPPTPTAPTATTGEPMDDALLRVDGVDAGYGTVRVLFGARVEVGRGEVLALLGTNGAGKSTLLKVIAGLLPADQGTIEYQNVDLRRSDAVDRSRRGIALMPGGRAIFPSLTVAENLRLGGWLHRDDPSDVLSLFPMLASRMATRAGLLSGGQQQMLGLAMSLLSRPELLLIDELSLGLAPAVVSELVEAVRRINAEGTTVLIVEQSLNVAASIADRAVFLERGAVKFDGRTDELLGRDDLARAVFLTAAAAPSRPPLTGGPSLEVRGLSVSFGGITALDEVDLSVPAHQIIGVIGSNGAGKTTLLDTMSGFIRPQAGTVILGGDDVTALQPAARAWRGLGRSFQGARLFPTLTVTETLALACERRIDVREPFASAFGLGAARRSEAAVRRRVDELLDRVHLGSYRNACLSELSTGTRRIVELACSLAHEPDVLLLDEPSSGLAQRETEALRDTLAGLRDDLGAALVVVEHDIPLVSSLADQLVCLHLGAVVAAGPPADVLADPAVIASYLGTDEATIARSGRRAVARQEVPLTMRSRSIEEGRA